MTQMKIRIAFREEGSMWNAYIAYADTMEKAKFIGSISMGAVKRNPEVKRAFMETMKMMLADAIELVTGDPPDHWDERTAPDSERSGHS